MNQPPSDSHPERGASSRWLWSLAWRFLRGRRTLLLSITARAALGSTGLGVAAMVVAMALMTGYTESVQRKLLGSGALIVYPPADESSEAQQASLDALQTLEGVDAVTFAVFAQGTLMSEAVPQGVDVVVRGVEPGHGLFGGSDEQLGLQQPKPIGANPEQARGLPGALLGRDLLERLDVEVGDRVRLMAWGFRQGSLRPKYRSVQVSGVFDTGFSEFDRGYVVVDREVVRGVGQFPGLFEISVNDPDQVGAVKRRAEQALAETYLVRDWRLGNPELFNALRLQKLVLFLVLGLIVVVSTFNVASTLMVLVRERTRDVGVLSALGLRPQGIQKVFLRCGLALGVAGAVFGVALGVTISVILTEFELIRFDSEVARIYFINSVPFRVQFRDLAAIVAFSLLVTFVACWWPARRASRIVPAQALRYE